MWLLIPSLHHTKLLIEVEFFCQSTLISSFQMKRCRCVTDWHACPTNVVIFWCLSAWRQCFTPVFSFKELQRKFSKIRKDTMELYKSYWLFFFFKVLLHILYTIVTSSGWLEYWRLDQCSETILLLFLVIHQNTPLLHKDTQIFLNQIFSMKYSWIRALHL